MGSGFYWKLDINRINVGLINVEEYSFECFTKSITYNVAHFANNNFAIDKTYNPSYWLVVQCLTVLFCCHIFL